MSDVLLRRWIFPGCEATFPGEEALSAFGAKLVPYTTRDGIALTGAWVRARGERSRVALFFHGNRDAASGNLAFASELAARGIETFLAEYRGYGGCGGKPCEEGLYRDGEAAVETALASGVADRDLVLVGRSLGTGVAVELARRGHGGGLVLISPYTSIREVVGARIGPLARLLVTDRFESAAKIGEVGLPTLVLHGTEDPVIAFAHAERLVRAAPAARLVALPGQGHRLDLAALAPIIASEIGGLGDSRGG